MRSYAAIFKHAKDELGFCYYLIPCGKKALDGQCGNCTVRRALPRALLQCTLQPSAAPCHVPQPPLVTAPLCAPAIPILAPPATAEFPTLMQHASIFFPIKPRT